MIHHYDDYLDLVIIIPLRHGNHLFIMFHVFKWINVPTRECIIRPYVIFANNYINRTPRIRMLLP